MAKTDPFAAYGKQVKRGRQHIADACDETTADQIVAALNAGRELVAAADEIGHHLRQSKAGHARAAALTPERRREIAQAAAKARWSK